MSIDSKFVFEFIAWVMVIMLVHSTCQKCILVRAWLALHVIHESTTFRGMRESVRSLASEACSLSSLLVGAFFDCTALGPTVILRALTCFDKGPETGGFSRVLGVVGIISIFMY